MCIGNGSPYIRLLERASLFRAGVGLYYRSG